MLNINQLIKGNVYFLSFPDSQNKWTFVFDGMEGSKMRHGGCILDRQDGTGDVHIRPWVLTSQNEFKELREATSLEKRQLQLSLATERLVFQEELLPLDSSTYEIY